MVEAEEEDSEANEREFFDGEHRHHFAEKFLYFFCVVHEGNQLFEDFGTFGCLVVEGIINFCFFIIVLFGVLQNIAD